MSRNPKYFTSDDFDAPVLLGDAWGYLNNVLRKCLVEGYNERTDLTSYEIIDNRTVRFTYATNHNYVIDRVLKLTGLGHTELDSECLIVSVTDLTVTVKYYVDLFIAIGTTANVTAKSIIAPLGMREKFRDGDKSVYVVDQEQEECFFVVDAKTPDNWTALATSTTYPAVISPVVYICDGMSDVDTVTGSLITPYDPANPTRYKDEWMGGVGANVPKKGIGFWQSYYAMGNTTTNTKTNATTNKLTWRIIGNGRFFYYITEPFYNNTRGSVFAFGQIKGYSKNEYILKYNSVGANDSIYNNIGLSSPDINSTRNISNVNSLHNQYYSSGCDMNLLNDVKIYHNVGYSILENNRHIYSVSVSGKNSSKYNMNGVFSYCDFTYFDGNSVIGYTPSAKFLMNGLLYHGGSVVNIKNTNGVGKRFVFIKHESGFGSGSTSSASTEYQYLFSLDYEDWKNYD